jgi:hypothetical protein
MYMKINEIRNPESGKFAFSPTMTATGYLRGCPGTERGARATGTEDSNPGACGD